MFVKIDVSAVAMVAMTFLYDRFSLAFTTIIRKKRTVTSFYILLINLFKTVAIDTPGGKRNLKMKIKAQQMTFRQDITKYKIYWLTFRCIVHNIFRAIKLIYKRVLYIYK
jgi:hypothetical protein